MPNKSQLETLDLDVLSQYAKIATHQERRWILQIMIDRNIRLRSEINEETVKLAKNITNYLDSIDTKTMDSNKG